MEKNWIKSQILFFKKKGNKFKDIYFLPLIIIYAFPLLLHSFSYDGSRLYFSFLVSLILPILIRIIFNIKPFVFVLMSIPVLIIGIMYAIMFLEFDSYVNTNTWNSIINSNLTEGSELSSELQTRTKFLIAIQVFAFIIYLFITFKKTISLYNNKIKFSSFILLVLCVTDFMVIGSTWFSFPARSMVSLNNYYKIKEQEFSHFETKKNAVFNAKQNKNTDKETIVVVIGESLRRDHLEYYGYKKPTTPLMKKEDLIIYTDVISPVNVTVNSLKRILTLANELDEEGYQKYPSLIKAFKEVGYKSYWISTQLVYDRYINEVSFIAQECDSIINKLPVNYDLTILNAYQNVLKNKEKKKIIFLHILGSHNTYKKKYPINFNFFDKNILNKKEKLIAQYNNTVRYNDYVVHQFLNSLKQISGEKSFIMFSDHGESLYESNPNHCFHGSDKPAKIEYEIPFVLWFSDEFNKNNITLLKQIKANKNKAIILSDLFHSLPTLYQINFNKLKKENNFFSKNYKSNTKRKVLTGSMQLKEYKKLKGKSAK